MAVPPASVRVPYQIPLASSVTSVAIDKGDNEMIPVAMHKSPYFYLTALETPDKSQLEERLMKGLSNQ